MTAAGRGLEELIQRADPEELLVEVDRLVAGRDWGGLVRLRDRCDAAVELGKQLWSVAQFAEYRLALEAPGPYAAAVCRSGAGRFALGPLTEVAASTHRWADLADHLTEPWIAATVAHERVLRGEDLTGDVRAHTEELELPPVLHPWEPDYPLPTYRPYELIEGGLAPLELAHQPVDAPPAPPLELPALTRALTDVATTWAEGSNGGCHVATVRGDAAGAVAALVTGETSLAPVAPGDVLARLAWTAASGGAYGRRAGMAAGRSATWWVATVATGLPAAAAPEEVGRALQRLRWYLIGGGTGDLGWNLRVAIADPQGGWAVAVDAWDRLRDDDPRSATW